MLIVAMLSSFIVQGQELPPALQNLVGAEHAFAAAAKANGVGPAFLEFMAEGATVFTPEPTKAKDVYGGPEPDQKPLLDWQPMYVEASSEGDLGFTTGPWTFRAGPDQPVIAKGIYTTVWKKTSQGYRFLFDGGVPTSDLVPTPEHPRFTIHPKTTADPGASESLQKAERSLNKALIADGSRGWIGFGTSDMRSLWPKAAPAEGLDASITLATSEPKLTSLESLGAGCSGAGDLGFSFGSLKAEGLEKPGGYLRVWRKLGEQKWQVVQSVQILPRQ